MVTDSPRHLHDFCCKTLDLKHLNSVLNDRQVTRIGVAAAEDPLMADERHHPALSVVLKIPKQASSPQQTQYMLDFRRCDRDVAVFRRLQNRELLVLSHLISKLTISSLLFVHC